MIEQSEKQIRLQTTTRQALSIALTFGAGLAAYHAGKDIDQLRYTDGSIRVGAGLLLFGAGFALRQWSERIRFNIERDLSIKHDVGGLDLIITLAELIEKREKNTGPERLVQELFTKIKTLIDERDVSKKEERTERFRKAWAIPLLQTLGNVLIGVGIGLTVSGQYESYRVVPRELPLEYV